MPHSKSDGHIDSLDKIDQRKPHHVRFEGSESIVLYDRNSSPSRGFVSPVRRCACGRPASTTDNVAENEIADILDSPTRRSRSPHKKLFGENGWLGRSPSVKEQSNKKAGLKTLGEKIKHHVGEIVSLSYPNTFTSEFTNVILGGRCGQGVFYPLPSGLCLFEDHFEIKFTHFCRSSYSGEDLLRNGSHDLCQCQQVPCPAIRGRSYVGGFHQQDHQLLDVQKSASSPRVSVRPVHAARAYSPESAHVPVLRRVLHKPCCSELHFIQLEGRR